MRKLDGYSIVLLSASIFLMTWLGASKWILTPILSSLWYFVCGALFIWSFTDLIFRKFHFDKADPKSYFTFIIVVVVLSGLVAPLFDWISNIVYSMAFNSATKWTVSPFCANGFCYLWGWVLYNFTISTIACVLALIDSRMQVTQSLQIRSKAGVLNNFRKRVEALQTRGKIAVHVYFLDRPRHVRFLIFSAVALALVAFSISRYYATSVQFDENVARAALTSTAEILTTILAISVSLIVVGLQYVSETYTPRATAAFLGDALFLGYLAVYSIVIFLIEGFLTFAPIPLNIILPYSYLLLIFCIIYLFAVIFHIPDALHPTRILFELSKKVKKDFCKDLIKRSQGRVLILGKDDEPFLALEQILLRAVVQNDFPTFLTGNKYLESLLSDFLQEVANEINGADAKSALREKPSGVFGYFLRIYREVVSEAISRRRELHLTYVTASLRRLMEQLHKMKAFRAFEWTAELYDFAGLQGLEVQLLGFLDDYVRGLEDLTTVQSEILDEPVLPFEGLGENSDRISDEERDLRADRSILYEDFRKRLDFVSELGAKAAKQNLRLLVTSFCMHILSETLEKTLKLEPVERKRGVLKTLVMETIMEAHKRCVENGANETTFTTGHLQYIIQGMKKEDVPEFGIYVASAYATMAHVSVEMGFYEEAFNWGVIARSLVENFPEVANIAINVTVDALEATNGKTDEKSKSWYSLARRDLVGLKTWRNHGHGSITERIDRELVKFPAVVSNLPAL